MHDNVAQSFDKNAIVREVLDNITGPIADATEAVHYLALAGHATQNVLTARAALETALQALTEELEAVQPIPFTLTEGALC